jgi:hypothetical protein
MEWFFATTEGFMARTSIMVVKNTDAFGVNTEDLLLRSWKVGKCSAAAVG